MKKPSTSPIPGQSSRPRRPLLAALLAAFVLAVFASSALAGALLKNGSFEKDGNGDGIPNQWDDFSIVIDPKRVCNQSYAGECSLKVVMDGNNKLLQQLMYVGGNSGDTFKLDFWVKRKQLVWGSGSVRIGFFFHHPDNSVESNYYYLNAGTAKWTHVIVFPSAAQDYDYMYIHILSDAQSGKAWFDKFRLVAEP
jgi:hypothetical protein